MGLVLVPVQTQAPSTRMLGKTMRSPHIYGPMWSFCLTDVSGCATRLVDTSTMKGE